MPKKSTRIPFEADRVYHIFNRGNNRENIFYSDSHYKMFLELYQKHPGTLADTYGYCLLKNHFHFLIRIKENADQRSFVREMRRWLISYAMNINREVNRKGHLFTRPIKRISVTDEEYYKHVLRYIHRNPLKHGITQKWETYPHSSYRLFWTNKSIPVINRQDALAFFNGDLLEFFDFHANEEEDEGLKRFVQEK